MDHFQTRLGMLVRQQREQMGITQECLAEQLDISVSFVGQIERGESLPNAKRLYQIINLLDIDPRAVFLEESHSDCPEFAELRFLMSRMSKKQKKLVLDFAKMIRQYKIT